MAAGLLPLEDAIERVLSVVAPLDCEHVALASALGRVLGEDVSAAEAVPAFANSAMDGFAVRAADVAGASPGSPVRLRLAGESRAGAPAAFQLRAGEAIAISTGAALPDGADAVVRVEDTRQGNGQVVIERGARGGQDVRQAGEDVRVGQVVLRRGTRLGAAELGVLASLGHAAIACGRRPRVSVLVSGDELVGPAEPRAGGAVRDTNSYSVPALARLSGGVVTGLATVKDDATATSDAIATAASGADALLTCGGVSVGRHDHVRDSLRELGAREVFWGVALKPGRPTLFATLDGVPVFGLPGNPVSAMVSFLLLARPALARMAGAAQAHARSHALLASEMRKPAGRTHAVRCTIRTALRGLLAEPTGAQGSHILTSMLGADALALLPAQATVVGAGEPVEIEPLSPWPWAST
jgi:molybdopterin molybdotransferase